MTNWIELTSGVVVLALGVLLIVYRAKLAGINASALRSFWGSPRTARRSTPLQATLTGAFFLLLAAFLIVQSLFG